MEFHGTGASEGTVTGKAVVYRHKNASPATAGRSFAGSHEAAMEQFYRGRQQVHEELCTLAREAEKKYGPDKAGIFEGYAEILMDDEIESLTSGYIREGCTPAQAARKALETEARELEGLDNAYLQERGVDLADIGLRLEAAISGETLSVLPNLTEPSILVADELSPFETVQLDPALILGLALDKGGHTGHVAILARSLGIPCVVALGNASAQVETGFPCALDGAAGRFILNPPEEVLTAFRQAEEARQTRLGLLMEKAGAEARTQDGIVIPVCANIGSPEEGREAVTRGADGVGLFRTEFLYLDTLHLPPEEKQFEKYRAALEALEGRPLTIRSLDIGGDKEHPALGLEKEDNPFLGYRAVRVGLDRPEILKPQVRAVLRATALGPVELMFPLVISREELRRLRALVEECRNELHAEGKAAASPPLGIMVETPAAALMARELAADADFFSIGTNDLTQYTLAVDRGNTRIAVLYDALHPAVVRLIAQTCVAAEEAGIPVGLCGELAGDETALPLLIGLGVTKLSMSPARIPLIKEKVRTLDRRHCRELARQALTTGDTPSLRGLLTGP